MSTNPANTITTAKAVPSRLWMTLAFFAIYVIWGTTYLAIRYAVLTIPPLVTAGVRHSVAGMILLALAWSRGFRPRREHFVAGAVLGALFFLVGHGTLHWAEQYVSSGLAALLVATEPLWILLIAAAVSGEFSSAHWSAVSTKSLLGLAYLIIFGSVVAFTAYSWLLQHCSATLVATHTFVNPLVAVLIGWFWAAEPLNARVVVATAIILGAIVLIQRGDRH